MGAIKDQAIVLRRLDYSETSQILAFLTREHGPRRLIAKGVKRSTKTKFAIGIDLLERGSVVFIPKTQGERSLATLTEWRQIEAYLGMRDNLRRWYAAQYAAEITSAMTEEADPHPELFDALVACLGTLAHCEDPLPLLADYQCALLTSAGLWPDLTRCVVCGRPAPPERAGYFSAHQGGLICRQCEPTLVEKRTIPAAILTALRSCRFDTTTARNAFEVLDYTISHAMGRAPALSETMRSKID